eukprot:12077-Hanusia_phi.AAC.1
MGMGGMQGGGGGMGMGGMHPAMQTQLKPMRDQAMMNAQATPQVLVSSSVFCSRLPAWIAAFVLLEISAYTCSPVVSRVCELEQAAVSASASE